MQANVGKFSRNVIHNITDNNPLNIVYIMKFHSRAIIISMMDSDGNFFEKLQALMDEFQGNEDYVVINNFL